MIMNLLEIQKKQNRIIEYNKVAIDLGKYII